MLDLSCRTEASLHEGSSTRCVMLLLHIDTSPEYRRFVTFSDGTLVLTGMFDVGDVRRMNPVTQN